MRFRIRRRKSRVKFNVLTSPFKNSFNLIDDLMLQTTPQLNITRDWERDFENVFSRWIRADHTEFWSLSQTGGINVVEGSDQTFNL